MLNIERRNNQWVNLYIDGKLIGRVCVHRFNHAKPSVNLTFDVDPKVNVVREEIDDGTGRRPGKERTGT